MKINMSNTSAMAFFSTPTSAAVHIVSVSHLRVVNFSHLKTSSCESKRTLACVQRSRCSLARCTIENANGRISHVEGPSAPRGDLHLKCAAYGMRRRDLFYPHTQWAAARCGARAQRPGGAADPCDNCYLLLTCIAPLVCQNRHTHLVHLKQIDEMIEFH